MYLRYFNNYYINERILQKLPFNIDEIFEINSAEDFEIKAVEVFRFQHSANPTYKSYCDLVGCNPAEVDSIKEIPFLPIEIFKSHDVKSFSGEVEKIFSSSGTTGTDQSRHYVHDISIYERSFLASFKLFYGDPSDYVILGLLPSYLEREGSSLIYMVDKLIQLSGNEKSGFYLNNYEELSSLISESAEEKILLIGVSYALLDLAEDFKPNLNGQIVMETGGMKGKREELSKEQLHQRLKAGLGTDQIHSEYGMTELLSQAYSKGDGIFECPPWMKILCREYNDPFAYTRSKAGGINVIDLANIFSCSFIATDDLGKIVGENDEKFKVLGRLDNADLRGCNLLIE